MLVSLIQIFGTKIGYITFVNLAFFVNHLRHWGKVKKRLTGITFALLNSKFDAQYPLKIFVQLKIQVLHIPFS